MSDTRPEVVVHRSFAVPRRVVQHAMYPFSSNGNRRTNLMATC